MIGHRTAKSNLQAKWKRGSQIHCYGDSGTPAMYYAKTSSMIEPYDSLQISSDVQAYAIGIGYSYKDCSLEHNHIPTKFVKITKEILKWLSQGGKNIIVVNHEECKLGK